MYEEEDFPHHHLLILPLLSKTKGNKLEVHVCGLSLSLSRVFVCVCVCVHFEEE